MRRFIGIGAGAHGKLSHPDGRIVRTWKTRLPKDYLNPAKSFQAGEKALTAEELPFEFLMNALRLTDGVDAALYPERTGLALESLKTGRDAAEQSGLLQVEPSRLAATDHIRRCSFLAAHRRAPHRVPEEPDIPLVEAADEAELLLGDLLVAGLEVGLHRADLLDGQRVRMDLAVNFRLAHAARDQLGILGTEIEDENHSIL